MRPRCAARNERMNLITKQTTEQPHTSLAARIARWRPWAASRTGAGAETDAPAPARSTERDNAATPPVEELGAGPDCSRHDLAPGRADQFATADGAKPASAAIASAPGDPLTTVRLNEDAEISAADSVLTVSAGEASVDALVDRITAGRSRPRRGPLYWLLMASSPVVGFMLVASLNAADLRMVVICAAGLVYVRAFAKLSAQMELDRAALANSDLDARWLGPLCEALEWPDKRVRGVAARLLARLLPRVREADVPGIEDVHRTCLYRRLRFREIYARPELALAILRALPKIGNEAGLSYVERLADGYAFTRDARAVRDAAKAALPALERRVAEQRKRAQAQAESVVGGEALLGAAVREAEAGRWTELSDADAEIVSRQMAEVETELKRLSAPGMRIGFLLAAWCVILPFFGYQAVIALWDRNWFFGLLCAALAAFCTQLYRWTMGAEHARLARRLSRIDDVRCVGRLAELLEWPEREVRDSARDALTKLLRRVKASDRVLAKPRERGFLHRALATQTPYRDAEFMESILLALGQVGDESSVPFVRPLAMAQPTTARHRRVQEAAEDCLASLSIRVELNRSSQTLLRGSSPSI